MIDLPEMPIEAREQAFSLLRCDGSHAAAYLTKRIHADLHAGREVAALAQMVTLAAIEAVMFELAAQAADRLRDSASDRFIN